jgi:hypothetical protein
MQDKINYSTKNKKLVEEKFVTGNSINYSAKKSPEIFLLNDNLILLPETTFYFYKFLVVCAVFDIFLQ